MSNEVASGRIFRRGVPVGPDVDKLMALDIRAGDRIGYGQVETIVGELRTSNRFQTIAAAWAKRLLREQSIVLKREGGLFIALTDPEKLTDSVNHVQRQTRAMGRQLRKLGTVQEENLTEYQRTQNLLLRRHMSSALGHLSDVRKAIAPPKPVGSR